MLKQSACVLAFFVAVSGAFAQFNIDFQRKHREAEAQRIFFQKKYAEAQAEFEELAETASDEMDKSKWLARAAIAQAHQEDQYEAAMQRAKQIEHRPYSVYAQMELMRMKDEHKAIVEAFGDEPIAEWPKAIVPAPRRGSEEDARAYGFYYRGTAYSETGEHEKAATDFRAGADLAQGVRLKLDVLRALATTLAGALNDPEGAFEANMRIVELGGGGADYYRGVLGAAAHLREQEKYEESLKLINSLNPYQQRGWWHGASLIALGQTLAAAGRTDEAVEAYQEAIDEKSNHRNQRGTAYLLLAEILAEAGRTDEAIATYEHMIAEGEENLRAGDLEQAQEALNGLRGSAE